MFSFTTCFRDSLLRRNFEYLRTILCHEKVEVLVRCPFSVVLRWKYPDSLLVTNFNHFRISDEPKVEAETKKQHINQNVRSLVDFLFFVLRLVITVVFLDFLLIFHQNLLFLSSLRLVLLKNRFYFLQILSRELISLYQCAVLTRVSFFLFSRES